MIKAFLNKKNYLFFVTFIIFFILLLISSSSIQAGSLFNGGGSGYNLDHLSEQVKDLRGSFQKDYNFSAVENYPKPIQFKSSGSNGKTNLFSLSPVYKTIVSSLSDIPKQTAGVFSSIFSPVGDFISGFFINEDVPEIVDTPSVKKSSSSRSSASSSSVIPAPRPSEASSERGKAGTQDVSNSFSSVTYLPATTAVGQVERGNLKTDITKKEVETLIQQSDDRNITLIRAILNAPAFTRSYGVATPAINTESLSIQQSIDNLSRRISVVQENNIRQTDHVYNSISRSFDDISSLDGVTMTNSSFSGTTGTFSGLFTGAEGTFSGDLTVSSELTVSGTGTSTISGRILATKAPTLAHSFSVWDTDTANSNVLDSSILINPSSAVADSNLFGIAVNGNVKFLVDAEGDVFVRNLTATGTVNQANTSISTLTVENTATFGDAVGDSVTFNAGTITSVNPISWNLPNSQTSALNFESGLFNLDTSNSRVGIGTSSPYSMLSVAGQIVGENFVATSTTATSTFSGGMSVAGSSGLTVLQNGNVGVGTAVPRAKLDIYAGNLDLDNTTNANQYGIITKNGTRFIHNFNYGDNGTVTTDGQNTFIGENAGNLTMGSTATQPYQSSYNTGIGYNSLFANTSGYRNTANGYNSLFANTSGSSNTANGFESLRSNTAGNNNTANGSRSLYSNTTGASNVGLGYYTGYGDGTTVDQRSVIDTYATFIGYQASRDSSVLNTTALTNITAIGKNARVGRDNSIVLGGTGADAVNVGIGTTSPYARLSVVGETVAEKFTATSTTATSTFAGGMNVAGTSGLTVLQNGNVGVGTAEPGAKLDVAGEFQVDSNGYIGIGIAPSADHPFAMLNTAKMSFNISATANQLNYWKDSSPSKAWTVGMSKGGAVGLTDDYLITSFTGSVWDEKMRITNAGNLGIGTTSPGTILSVSGVGNFAGTGSTLYSTLTAPYFTATSTTATSTFAGGMNVAGTAGLTVLQNGNVGVGTASPTGKLNIHSTSPSADEILFDVSTNAGTRFSIDEDGDTAINIGQYSGFTVNGTGNANFPLSTFTAGIGAQTGQVPLVLYSNQGNIDVTTLKLKSASASPGNQNRLDFTFGDIVRGRIASELRNIAGADLVFSTHLYPAFDAITEVMRITKEGNLGIGTTSPYAKLTVWSSGTSGARIFEGIDSASTTVFSISDSGIFTYGKSATSTIPSNTNYAWSIATSTTASPIFSISTQGSGANLNATTTINGGLNLDNGALLYDYSSGITTINALETGPMNFADDAGMVTWFDLAITSSSPLNTPHSYTAQIDSNDVLTVYGESDGAGVAQNLRVGIGTTTPLHKLSIYNGTSTASIDTDIGLTASSSASIYSWVFGIDTSDAGKFKISSSTALGTNDRLVINGGGNVGLGGCADPDHIFEIGGTGTGCNTGAGSYLNAVGDLAFTANSSREWKDNITTYGRADILSRIKNAPVRTFDWKPEYCPSGNCLDKLGFIAEEFYGVLERGDDKHVNGQDVTMALWLGMQNFINVFDIASSATGTPALLIDALGNWKIGNDGALTVKEVRTEKLCVGSVCVTEEQFRSVFGSPEATSHVDYGSGGSSSSASASASASSQTISSSLPVGSSSSSSSAFSSESSSSAQSTSDVDSGSVNSSAGSSESSASSVSSQSLLNQSSSSQAGSDASGQASSSSSSSSSSAQPTSDVDSGSSSVSSTSSLESSSSTSSSSDSSVSSSSSVAESSSSSSESASSEASI